MLNMMANGNKERGAMMGRDVVMNAIAQTLLGEVSGGEPPGDTSQGQLREHGAAVMRALQAGNVDAFTNALQRFFIAMEESEDDENPFDLEVG
jgi:hypothetical protein